MKFWSGVVTEKVQESRDFYVRLFGCQVLYEGEGGWFVLLCLGESELGFMKPGLDFQAPIYRPAFQGQGMWITVDVDDVDAQYARIRGLGTPIEVELRDEPWGDRHFAVRDPNGIGVDVVERRPAQA
ncbi:MAG TPA: glyoxalase/bleomycin resistance/extradiol dioxygenase family protein [Curvibacter sp.]|nr:glyoxalase/bleomycin resistance/extradiol dioxygenase family protein [Curvibacter sp.]